jgi:ribose transport system substrate-binding protein
LTTFERRQRLQFFLKTQPGIRVPELSKALGVSEGTIRNDLRALADTGELTRVRGGAVLRDGYQGRSPAFSARAKANAASKQFIARWAADLIEDGDSILLDASTTVYNLAQFLRDRHNLTVVTNGIEVGWELARNRSNTVILLGGVLRSDGTSITGSLSEQFLKDLHVKTAFVSCSGFSIEAGLTEVDFHEVQLKSNMIASAGSVVALIDSSKFGKVDLTPFARTEQIQCLFTDRGLDAEPIEQLQRVGVSVTLCAADRSSTFTPRQKEARHFKIGFANLNERDPFPIEVRRGLERAAREAGNIDLVLADNQLSADVALDVAYRFMAQGVDLMIEYQIDEQAGSRIMEHFQDAGIPVIAVDIPMVGATFFGVDNYRAGRLAGEALGRWLQSYWEGKLERVVILEEPRAGALPAMRIQGQLDGLQSVIGPVPEEKLLRLNSGNTSDVSQAQVLSALKTWPPAQRLAVISFNDDVAMGALLAVRQLEREADVVIVGQGADRRVREELHRPGTRIIGSTAFQPELYGEKLIPLALKILDGQPVPPAMYMEHVFVPSDGLAPEAEELEKN